MTLRLVHDPDTAGCGNCPLSTWFDPPEGPTRVTCAANGAAFEFEWSVKTDTAPPWCPLRAGDVVVTAGKDGG